jgi:dTDP-4-dehydrorhamnose 3,5-epimerase
MQVSPTAIADVLLIEPKVFGDERGFFLESFNQKAFNAAVGRDITFVQDNHSRSRKGVLRGLHFQQAPHAQGKLVRVIQGSVFDVAVDVRRDSPTFGKWVGIELSAANHKQLWIPAGLAHGFLVTSDSADFLYKTTDYYRTCLGARAALGRSGLRHRLARHRRAADAVRKGRAGAAARIESSRLTPLGASIDRGLWRGVAGPRPARRLGRGR